MLSCRLSVLGSVIVACLTIGGSDAAAQLTVTLTPTNYNGYHVTCFGKKDGAILATVAGGTAPYTYLWSNGFTVANLEGLPSGYYRVTVTDALNEVAVAEVTLIEPRSLRLSADAYRYPNGYNLSCFDCFNGSIATTVIEGVAPYTYVWDDGGTTQNRSGLGAMSYTVQAIDANGCESNAERITLTQPERTDWRMDGNTGSNPGTHFIGTADAKDLVFKSNGTERLRLLSGGDVKLTGPLLNPGVVYLDENGVLRGGGPLPTKPPIEPGLCRSSMNSHSGKRAGMRSLTYAQKSSPCSAPKPIMR